MGFQPGQHTAGEFWGVAVAAGMRRRAHAAVEDALRRGRPEVDRAFGQMPLLEWQLERVQGGAQWRHPLGVFMQDVDLRHGAHLYLTLL